MLDFHYIFFIYFCTDCYNTCFYFDNVHSSHLVLIDHFCLYTADSIIFTLNKNLLAPLRLAHLIKILAAGIQFVKEFGEFLNMLLIIVPNSFISVHTFFYAHALFFI